MYDYMSYRLNTSSWPSDQIFHIFIFIHHINIFLTENRIEFNGKNRGLCVICKVIDVMKYTLFEVVWSKYLKCKWITCIAFNSNLISDVSVRRDTNECLFICVIIIAGININKGNLHRKCSYLCLAPTSVHGPTSEECSVLVNTPAMTGGMFPWDLEDSR